MSAATVMAKDVIASLKSGVLLKGIVRSHSTHSSMNIAWIAIEFPVVGERQILVNDEQNLHLGQQVVVECVRNRFKPGRYMFQMVEVLMSMPTGATSSLMQKVRNRCQWRLQPSVLRRAASEE